MDARGCDAALIADLTTLRTLFAHIIEDLGLTPVADAVWHVFPPPGGITGLVALAESHLTVHTFPEFGSLCLNLFCCRARAEWPWAERLRALIGATHVDVVRLDRSYAPHAGTPLWPPRPSHEQPPSTTLAR